MPAKAGMTKEGRLMPKTETPSTSITVLLGVMLLSVSRSYEPLYKLGTGIAILLVTTVSL